MASEFVQTAQAISAKVSKTGGTAEGFSWELTDSSWVVKSGNTVLFSVDANDVTIRMKNQNVVIDDTGIDFSSNATLKFSSITCFSLQGGYVGMGHPNFNAYILANQLFLGTSANYLNHLDIRMARTASINIYFGSSISPDWKITRTNFGPYTAS